MNAALPVESPGRPELVFALGVGLLLVSGLLPWVAASEAIPVADPSEEADGLSSFDGDSTSEEILGIDRVDWVVLAGVGLVATGLVVTEPWSQLVLAIAAASGVAVVGLGVAYLVDPAWMYSDWIKTEVAAVASAGPGVYLAIGGGVLQLGGCYLAYSSSGSTTGAQQLDAPPSQPGPTNQPTQPEHPPQGRSADGRQQPQTPQQRPPGQHPPQGTNQGRGPGSAQPPTDQQSPGRQPPQNQQPADRSPDANDVTAEPESTDQTAGDSQRGSGAGQQRESQNEREESDGTDGSSERTDS